MKKTLLITLLANTLFALAQTPHVFVANGGKFEHGVDVYEDRATIGVFDTYNKEYRVLDTINVESVQSIVFGSEYDGVLFVAAQDSIVSYFYDEHSGELNEIDQIGFAGIKMIEASADYVAAGKWYGIGDYLVVYDHSLIELYTSPTIKNEVKDLLFVNDSLLAVSYNLQGSVDGCAPWGCFQDSVGMIDVINLNSLETIKTIDLGERGKGEITLSKVVGSANDIVAVSSANQLLTYIDNEFNIASDTINSGFVKTISGQSSYNYGGMFMITSDDSLSMVAYSHEDQLFHWDDAEAKAVDAFEGKTVWDRGEVFGIVTNYSTTGIVVINNNADTIAVGVSPEDVAVGYFGPMGIFSSVGSTTEASTAYFATQVSDLELTNVSIYTASGEELIYLDNAEYFDSSYLESGVYVLKAQKNSKPVTYRILKR